MKTLKEKLVRVVKLKKHFEVSIIESAPNSEDPNAVSSVNCLMTEEEFLSIKGQI